jgi:hypothetical protein
VLKLSSIPARSSALAAGLPSIALVGQVDQDEVVVGAAGDEVEAVLGQRRRQRLGVGHDLVRVVRERRLRRLVQGDRDAGRGVVVRAALQAGEHGLVDGGRVLAVVMSIAPRGPRRVLCVVVEMTSA